MTWYSGGCRLEKHGRHYWVGSTRAIALQIGVTLLSTSGHLLQHCQPSTGPDVSSYIARDRYQRYTVKITYIGSNQNAPSLYKGRSHSWCQDTRPKYSAGNYTPLYTEGGGRRNKISAVLFKTYCILQVCPTEWTSLAPPIANNSAKLLLFTLQCYIN